MRFALLFPTHGLIVRFEFQFFLFLVIIFLAEIAFGVLIYFQEAPYPKVIKDSVEATVTKKYHNNSTATTQTFDLIQEGVSRVSVEVEGGSTTYEQGMNANACCVAASIWATHMNILSGPWMKHYTLPCAVQLGIVFLTLNHRLNRKLDWRLNCYELDRSRSQCGGKWSLSARACVCVCV